MRHLQPTLHPVLAVAVSLLSFCGCRSHTDTSPSANKSDKLEVVTTIFPLADWVRNVGGDRVHVTTLLPAGRSPHTFDPTPAEIRTVAHSQLFFKVGLKMDDWGSRLASAGTTKLKVVSLGNLLADTKQLPDLTTATEAAQQIAADEAHHDHDHEGVNPHYWLDIQLAKLSVEQIRNDLSAADPQGAATYARNAQAYLDQLTALDTSCTQQLSPCANQPFVSFHDAYPYLAQRYGLHIAGVIEEYPGKTPSEKYIKTLSDKLREMNIKTVFAEPQLNPQIADILAREVGATVDILDPYGSESSDDRNTYLRLIQYNVTHLAKALCAGTTATTSQPR